VRISSTTRVRSNCLGREPHSTGVGALPLRRDMRSEMPSKRNHVQNIYTIVVPRRRARKVGHVYD
jgi:hypothetical protein